MWQWSYYICFDNGYGIVLWYSWSWEEIEWVCVCVGRKGKENNDIYNKIIIKEGV